MGTRLRPLTNTTPKCLVPIGGTPLLELWLRKCEHAGLDGVLINTHHLSHCVEEFVASRRGISVTLTHERELLGSAGTIAANWDFAGSDDSFLAIYADNLTTFCLSELLHFHARHDQIASVALFRSPTPKACGVVEMNDSGLITGFWEKPDNPPGNLCNAGLYAFRRQIRPYLPTEFPSDVGRSLLPALVGHARGLEIDDYFVDIGTLENYQRAQADYAAACRGVEAAC